MKPISLTLAGLHSFRQKQTIDFTQVYDGGIFGIFGPTGSGKSTILDAITLALYGRVERTDKNRVGILNQQENKVHVSFVFELSSNQSTQRYLVERVYQRTEENRNRSTIARLIKIEQNIEEVLADKETDVNNRVEELLGLKNDDFTRAVVLPQGKFAEFLTLKASNRREMLERLFNLDKYGNKLRERVNQYRKDLEGAKDKLTAQQQVLGNATEEAVETLNQDLKAATALKTTKEQELAGYLIEFKQLEKYWDTKLELIDVRKQLEALQQQEEEINALVIKKEHGDRAALVYPTVKQYDKLREQLLDLQNKAIELTSNKEQLQVEVEGAKQEFEQRKKNLEEKAPVLTERKYKLQEAIELKAKILTQKNTLLQLGKESEEIKPLKEALESQVTILEKELKNYKESLAQINKTMEYVTVSTDERKRLEIALQAMQELISMNKEMEAKDGEFQKNETKIVELEIKNNQLLLEINSENADEQRIFKGLEKLNQIKPISEEEWHRLEKVLFEAEIKLNKWMELEREKTTIEAEMASYEEQFVMLEGEQITLQKTIAEIEGKLEQRKHRFLELEKMRKGQLILELAKQLEEGKPCAVCGSTHHPAPRFDEDNYEVDTELERMKEEINYLDNSLTKAKIDLHGLEQTLVLKREQWKKENIQLEDKIKELINLKTSIQTNLIWNHEEITEETSVRQFVEMLNAEKMKHHKQKNTLIEWNQQYEQLLETKEQQKELLSKRVNNQKVVESELNILKTRKQEILEDYKALEDEKKELEQTWEKKRGAWNFTTILHRKQEIDSFDNQREKLQMEWQEIDGAIKTLEEKLKRVNEELSITKAKLAELELHDQNENKSLTEAEGKYNSITNGEAANSLIDQVTKELEELNVAKDQAEKMYRSSNEEWNKVELSLVSNQAVLDKLEIQWQETEEQLNHLLTAHHFISRDEVINDLLEPEELKELEVGIKDFHNRKHLLTEHEKQYLVQLEGRDITEDEWVALQAKRDAFIQEVELLKERVQELGFSYSQMKKDYESWQGLEKERKRIQADLDVASELSDVMKGNAFVDFIAQEYLRNVTMIASEKLLQLTRNRYSIKVEQDGEFSLIDELNGSLARPVQSLSGGETFLTSLALALALSSQIQLKGGKTLEFFFLDEGFGSLDSELLDTVMMTLEKIHVGHLTIGIISHVPELQSRINRKFIVTPPDARGNGSKVHME